MDGYGADAFLLQWEGFTSTRGYPQVVWSDKGLQLTSSSNYVTWAEREDPSRWEWNRIQDQAGSRTEWRYVPAGCQFRNGLAESRVKAVKHTPAHTIAGTMINAKPTLSYLELQVFLAQANIVNDRHLGLRSLSMTF